MLFRRALTAACVAALLPLSGCTSDDPGVPDTPPTEMKARLIQDGDSKTYDMTACAMTGEQSLTAYATDQVSELMVINIENGSGAVSLLNGADTPPIEGTTTNYAPEPDGMFTIDGVYPRDGEEATFTIWGNCNPEPEA